MEKDHEYWYEHHQQKRETTRKYFSIEQVSEIYNALFNNPQQDEYVANEFLNIIKQYPIRKSGDTLLSVVITRIHSTNTLCIDPKYRDENGKEFSTTMVLMHSNDIGILASRYTMEAHIQVLDFFHSIPRQIKIMNVLQ